MSASHNEHSLLCVDRAASTHDMTTFTFKILGSSDAAPPFAFYPGQFLTITVEIDGREMQRCYSISSSPTRVDTVSISVKHVAGGYVSGWLQENLVPGMTLRAQGPLGSFSYVCSPADKYLFVSAGSGITPMISMVRAITDSATPADIVFIHSARTIDDIPFRSELEQLTRDHPTISISFAYTRSSDNTRAWAGHRGRIDGPMLSRVCPDLDDREVFLCGPGPFRTTVRSALLMAGVDRAHIHEENFGFTLPPGDPAKNDGVQVDFTRRARRINVPPGCTILAAAAAAGVTLPSSCGIGMCGSCKVNKVSGDVVMNHQGGIRHREVEQGKVLLCCAEPTSPVVIDF